MKKLMMTCAALLITQTAYAGTSDGKQYDLPTLFHGKHTLNFVCTPHHLDPNDHNPVLQVNINLKVNNDYTPNSMGVIYFLNDQSTIDRSHQYYDFQLQKRDGILGWMWFGTLRRNPNTLMMGEVGYGDNGWWYEETIHSTLQGNDYSHDEKLIPFYCAETANPNSDETM